MNHKLYLTDHGIFRNNNKFYYSKTSKQVTDKTELNRLNSLKVPPAWNNLWFASNKNCHIQAHGIDVSGKKQYILSEKWVNSKRCEKFNRLKMFIKDINAFKNKIKIHQQEINGSITKSFLIKFLFNLLLTTHIRVGNEIYATTNKTYGLTTLQQRHLIFKNGKYYFSFVGKSKISQEILIPDEYQVLIKKFINNKPKSLLFYYYSGSTIKNISSEELNIFLKENMGKEYTCKDFRTYSANVLFIKEFLKSTGNTTGNTRNYKKIVLGCIDKSAEYLGHTRTICKKSYISNNIIDYCLESFPEASKESFSGLLSRVSS